MVDSFENLIVWQKSMDMVEHVYAVTKSFPIDERYGLVSQMRRASCSVPANIAEGYGRLGRKDYIRCLGIARGSVFELITLVIVSIRVGLVTDTLLQEECDQVIRMTTKLITSLQASITKESSMEYGLIDGESRQEILLDP